MVRQGEAGQGRVVHTRENVMAVEKVGVEITGTSALLMHRWPESPTEGIEKLSADKQAELSAYQVPDTGELYVPGVNVQRSLVAGAAFSKGKGRASLQKLAAACMFVSPERLLLGVHAYTIDSRRVVVPATKGAVTRHRPRLDAWKIGFELEYDGALLSAVQVRKIVDDAFSLVGIGDFRPACKGPFGRGVVTHWETG